jgi:hypothetical protein
VHEVGLEPWPGSVARTKSGPHLPKSTQARAGQHLEARDSQAGPLNPAPQDTPRLRDHTFPTLPSSRSLPLIWDGSPGVSLIWASVLSDSYKGDSQHFSEPSAQSCPQQSLVLPLSGPAHHMLSAGLLLSAAPGLSEQKLDGKGKEEMVVFTCKRTLG